MPVRRTAAQAATTSRPRTPSRGVTRRNLLATGGLAGAAALVGLGPFRAPAAEAATSDGVPDYLVRSSYLGMSDTSFGTTDGAKLTLEFVRDLPVASSGDRKLAGSEDAFALTFRTTSQLQQGVYTFTHSTLGNFDFLVVPNGEGTLEVIVNRSVNAPQHAPRPRPGAGSPPPTPHSDEPTDDPMGTDPPEPHEPSTGAGHGRHHRKHKPKRIRHLRRASARRVGRHVVAELRLTPDAHVKSATVWLVRGERVISTGEVKRVHGNRAVARLDTAHRPRGGRYELVVITFDRHRRSQAQRVKVTLQ